MIIIKTLSLLGILAARNCPFPPSYITDCEHYSGVLFNRYRAKGLGAHYYYYYYSTTINNFKIQYTKI